MKIEEFIYKEMLVMGADIYFPIWRCNLMVLDMAAHHLFSEKISVISKYPLS